MKTLLHTFRTLAPGLAAAAAVAVLGKYVAAFLSRQVAGLAGLDPAGADARSLVSAVSMAVLLGLAVRNSVGVHAALRPGIAWAARTGLRAGIVLLGFKLALGTAGRISAIALPVAAACIATALVIVSFVSRRVGLRPKLGALIAVGTSVCGVSAIAATGPAIAADEDETSYAIACITIFGLLALFTYPWLAHAAFGESPLLAGVFLGTSIHDTSQVAGAALMYQETFTAPLALQAATVTKLLRNMSMAVLIPFVAIRFRTEGRRLTLADVKSAVPVFVLLFLGAIFLRSAGDALLRPEDIRTAMGSALWMGWHEFLKLAAWVSGWALAAALAGVGMGTDLAKLRRLGLTPLLVGFVAAASVGVVSFVLLKLGAAAWMIR